MSRQSLLLVWTLGGDRRVGTEPPMQRHTSPANEKPAKKKNKKQQTE